MSSPAQIARQFLNWFDTEAQDNGSELFYVPGTDTIIRYVDKTTGVLKNAYPFCASLAYQRLTIDDAQKVLEAVRVKLDPTRPAFRC